MTTYINEIHNHRARNYDNLRNEQRRTKKTQGFPVYRAIQSFNKMHSSVRNKERKKKPKPLAK